MRHAMPPGFAMAQWAHSIYYRMSGLPSDVPPPGRLPPFCAGGATSGFVAMPGSRLGGFTAPRGSPRFSGTCWMPGSIRDGEIGGTLDSNGFSGALPGVGSPARSGGAGGSPAAEIASAGRRIRMAMATSRGAFRDHPLVENAWGPLPHLCFDHDILTSSSVMML